jgi:hypothetical protein
MACLGFFFVYFIEELSLKVFASPGHHGHSHGNQPQYALLLEFPFKRSSRKQDLDPRTVLAGDQPMKLQTSLNGSSVIQTNVDVLENERKSSRHSLNTHE